MLVDTSAWIEFLRDTGSPTCLAVDRLLDSDLVTCDPVRMELMCGARTATDLDRVRRLLARYTTLPVTPVTYDRAASVFRTCRSRGETVRKTIDCLIAACAIDAGVAILHRDSDYDALARHTALRVVETSA